MNQCIDVTKQYTTTSLLNELDSHLENMQPKLFINVLIDYLAEDVYWLNDNINEYDMTTLMLLVNRLKTD